MRMILVSLLCLGLCGCATTAKYEAKLNSWVGASEDALIAAWGVPDQEYHTTDGKKAIAYLRKNTVQTGGYPYTVPQTSYHSGTIGDKSYSGTSTQYVTEMTPVQNYRFYCKTSFIIDKSGKVESWHYEGNNCVSP
jgi:hypothetical protein